MHPRFCPTPPFLRSPASGRVALHRDHRKAAPNVCLRMLCVCVRIPTLQAGRLEALRSPERVRGFVDASLTLCGFFSAVVIASLCARLTANDGGCVDNLIEKDLRCGQRLGLTDVTVRVKRLMARCGIFWISLLFVTVDSCCELPSSRGAILLPLFVVLDRLADVHSFGFVFSFCTCSMA